MKRKLLLPFLAMLLLSAAATAQGVSKLFGLVGGYPQASHTTNGFLFSTDSTGNNFEVKYQFPVTNPGGLPANMELAQYNGKLYGTTLQGGSYNSGVIFEYDPTTNIYTKKYDFNTAASAPYSPKGGLLLYNSKFYGLTESGGTAGGGTIFEWDPATNIFTKKYDFSSSTGIGPQNSLRLNNNKMYGTTSQGGPANTGVVFEWNPANNTYTDLFDLNGTNGWGFYGNVTVYNNKLYCMSQQGAANNSGALYSIDPALPNGSNTVVLKVFDGTTGATGNNNEMIVYNNKLYGCTFNGGSEGGVLFELNPATGTYTKLVDFSYTTTGRNPLGRLVPNGSKFLGVCNAGGINGSGTIFEWDPANPNTVVKKVDFPAGNFTEPINPGTALCLFNSKFYATTYNGGFVNRGTLYEYNYAAGTITKKLNFDAAETGRVPYGKPTLLNGKIYGTCYTGPQEIFGTPYGTIWEYDPSTSVYSAKVILNNMNNAANGRAPISSPVAYNGKLYGLTSNGGISDYGVLYEYDPVTNIYSKKDIQSMGTGAYPDGELTLYNNKFYGMLSNGGIGNLGIIFSYDPATGVLTKLYDINNIGSAAPASYFAVYNNKFYGTTTSGGANGSGAVFSYDPATNTAVSLADLSTPIGSSVRNAFTVYNNKLYNTALGGGTSRGTIFSFDPATNALTNIYNFVTTAGGNGYDPQGGLTISGNKMYCITSEVNNVNIVEFDPAGNAVSLKSTYAGSPGNLPVAHNGLTVVPAFIANGVAGSCENYPTVVINAANNNKWVPILNPAGDVVAEIKANGNNLGNVTASVYINSGPVREDFQKRMYLDRNISITVQNQPSSNVDVRLYIKKSEFATLKNALNSQGQPSGISTENDLAVFKSPQTCTASLTAAVIQPATASVYEYGYIYTASIPSFSTFFFAKNTFVVLPVTLVDFSAAKKQASVDLSWNTENEINLSYFTIEKSNDKISWKDMATVNAHNTGSRHYNATDGQPYEGKNYYRLRETATDGNFTYSKIVAVNFSKSSDISISPNPADDMISIQSAGKITAVLITDLNGRTVQQLPTSANNRYDISNLKPGIYFAKIFAGGEVQTGKFVKK